MNVDSDVDALVGRLIPTARLPRHLQPRDLLDEDVVPPESIAARVHALRALIRTGGREATLTGTISTSRDIAAFFTPRLRSETTESIWVVGLDARNRVRFTRKLASGNATNCAISAAEAARPLVLNGVGHGIVVHNHPSGDPTPSHEDLEITVRIAEAFDVLGLRLLDHVIVGSEGYTSMLDSGVGPFGAAYLTRRLR